MSLKTNIAEMVTKFREILTRELEQGMKDGAIEMRIQSKQYKDCKVVKFDK